MKLLRSKILFVLCLLSCLQVQASHIVGGEVTYKYLGFQDGAKKYQISVTIYEDCKNGQPDAIAMDTPAFLAAYNLTNSSTAFNYLVNVDTNVHATISTLVPVNFNNSCVTNVPQVCLLKKTFVKEYLFYPPWDSGFVVAYQRCCRNAAIVNIIDPGDIGATYYCVIPGTHVAGYNNSAIFNNFPPQIICKNNPLDYDNSATDPDGDSLSYEFCNTYKGADASDIKPIPGPPPYDTVNYVNPPFSYQHPMTGYPPIVIDPVTGRVTGTPNRLGRYLVTVCCHEWRNGVMINTIKREFQFVVTDCSKVVVASIPQLSTDPNTYIVECSDYKVNFENTSTGGFAYFWNFGVQGINYDTSNLFAPSYVYPDTGTYAVKLVVNPASTCPDSISRLVKVYPKFHTQFADSGGRCPGTAIQFSDSSFSTLKPVTGWQWSFGDGSISGDQNPVHSYTYGGTYNVELISQNYKHCTDTIVHQVLIENFQPFAGKDTIIVKGERIQFEASGGTDYEWSPAENLNNGFISNPIGYYPDTGTFVYTLHVKSSFGCEGYDTIKVWVVNQASFFMPTGFSPNGDGKNDYFRPVAVGYKTIKYFKVFDRWGEEVYFGRSLSEGWDGTYKQQKAQLGTYFWEIDFVDRLGKESFLKGDVTLVR